jgi:hypothetical protein
VRRGTGSVYRRAQSIRFLLGRDRRAVLSFLRATYPARVPLRARLALLRRFITTTNHVRTYHTQAELLRVADRILRLAGRPDLTRLAGGRLLVFDSFRGIPPNDEVHRNLWGRPVVFRAGAFRGRLPAVRRTVARFGAPEVCDFRKGWFADTLPALDTPIDVGLLDVDLLSSTRTCLIHLVPRLRPGGALFTQDGHLEAVVALLRDERFWRDDVGVEPPRIRGLGRRKLLEIAPV